MDLIKEETSQKRRLAMAKQVARLLVKGQATCTEVYEILQIVPNQMELQMRSNLSTVLPINEGETQYHVCPKCEKVWHHEDAYFCSRCGANLDTSR